MNTPTLHFWLIDGRIAEISPLGRDNAGQFLEAQVDVALKWHSLRIELCCRIFENRTIVVICYDIDLRESSLWTVLQRDDHVQLSFAGDTMTAVIVHSCTRDKLRKILSDDMFELGYMDVVRMDELDLFRIMRYLEETHIDSTEFPLTKEESIRLLYDALVIRWLCPNGCSEDEAKRMFEPTCNFVGCSIEYHVLCRDDCEDNRLT